MSDDLVKRLQMGFADERAAADRITALEAERDALAGNAKALAAELLSAESRELALAEKLAMAVEALRQLISAYEEWDLGDTGKLEARPLHMQSTYIQRARATLAQIGDKTDG